MIQFARRIYEHYRNYHAYGPPRLKYMGWVGATSVLLFYFLRFTRPRADPFDDVVLRAIAFVLFLGLAAKDHWPERLKPYYIGFSYVVLLYCLPCFNVLTALERGGGMPAISNSFIVLCFLVLLTDWRNTLVMLVAGTSMAAGIYIATNPNPHVPMDLVAQLPAFALIVLGGNLFKFSTEQIDAERKLRATEALAASIAHEMRNPLSRIRHNLEKMQHALPPPTTTGQAQAIGPAQTNALYRHLAESEVAVNRGLQVIAMTLDEVSEKPFDATGFSLLGAADASRKALQEYAFESEEDAARVQLQVENDFVFRGDETAYLFVIFNLLKNALYYFPTHPQARVTITVGDHHVRVRDTGPGMPGDVVTRLFQPFTSIGKPGGTGLGLAYCRRVMQAFGGEIGCHSAREEYTEFVMRFPPVDAQESESHRDSVLDRARAALRGHRLLIVDDDAAQRLTTRHKLLTLGAEIDQAADGQRAIEQLARGGYDLVLLDLNMPVMDGYEFAERVRAGQVPGMRDVAIVAYTSEHAHVASVKTRKAGMDAFVGKPASQLQLVRAMLEGLRHAKSARLPVALAARRILVADDSAQSRKAVSAYLRHAGAVVTECEHGQAVLDALKSGLAPDAVLLDINMPGMDGLQTSRAIRALDLPAAHVPIVALTAHSDDATVRAAQAAGMTDFISKPVEASILYEKLAQFVAGPAKEDVPPKPTFSPVAGGGADVLLNIERLESYRHIGMLGELLDDYLPSIAGLVGKLQRHFAQQDLKACTDTLHSLLGMSGEAGAQALYQAVRRVYVPMVEAQAWPAQGGWVQQIAALSADTEKALKAYAISASIAQGKE
ncbi:MAG TPA: response regulator [Ramlibacter sp.]|nr:response regulator [Ramlibacter sp.]